MCSPHTVYNHSMRQSKYTKELLGPIVAASPSMAQVIQKLGLRLSGGNYRMIDSRVRFLGLDTSHFKGQGWAKGLTADDHQGVSNFIKSHSFTDDEVFNENSPVVSGHRLTKRLLRLGWTYKCECDLDSWRGKPLTLHLDHINGMRNDNRFSNLRFLCPNCHQQTETWGNKKRNKTS